MTQLPQPSRPFSILIAALGGEGGGVLAEWIVAAATAQGFPVQSTSIPGVAQRTGATTYYVELWPSALARPDGARPLMTLAPAPGQVDVLLASELLEAGRAMLNGFVNPERTTLIASTHRVYTTIEKMQMGDGRFDSERVLDAAAALSRRAILFDMQSLAQASASMINAVLFGALAGSGELPLPRESCERAIRAAGKGTQASLAGFASGFKRAAGLAPLAPAAKAPSESTLPGILAGFPAQSHEVVMLGLARVSDFQNKRYADRYLERLRPIAALDPAGGDSSLTRETARLLALWMSYEDVIRVADLKSRGRRVRAVRAEVRAQPHELVHIVEYFKPRLEEFASLLPPAACSMLLRFARKSRLLRRFNPGLHIKTTSLGGFLMLRTLALLKPLRPRTARFAEEQALIERWLGAVWRAAGSDAGLALEIVLCARLIKGYGETRERGKNNFLRIFEALVEPNLASANVAGLASSVREAREAALADAEGRGLENALAARGITPLAPRAKPLVFVRRPTEKAA